MLRTNPFKISAFVVNVLFAFCIIIFASTTYQPRNILEFSFFLFFLSIPIVSIYVITSRKASVHTNTLDLTSSTDTSFVNVAKRIAILLNVAMVFFLALMTLKNQNLLQPLGFLLFIPSLLALFALCFDDNWQWIGFHTSREIVIERRTYPYNKLAVIAFFFSILPVIPISLVSLSLALLFSAIGSILGLIALFEIRETKERGSMLAYMAITMRGTLKVIVYLLTIHR